MDKKNKVFAITEKDEFQLVKKINGDTRNFFAITIFQKGNGWVAFCYYKNGQSK